MNNVFFITDKVYPYFVGGQEKRIYTYAKILSENKEVKVSIVSMKWWQGKNIIEKEGIRYISVCQKYSLYKKNGKRKILPNMWFSFSVFRFLLKSEKKEIDLLDVEIFPYFPVIFTRLASFLKRGRLEIVGHWCECQGKIGWKRYSKFFWFLGLWLEKLAKKSCDRFITISEFTKKRMTNFLGIDEKRITVIPPSFIDFKKIEKIKSKKKECDFIYFGRLIWHKHVEVMIELSLRFKAKGFKIKSLIIGDGPEKFKLKRRVEKLKLDKEVEFLDFLDNYSELIRKIKFAKVMVFPSEREGLGIAPIEANTCGLPVLVLDHPENATKILIKNRKNGFVCKDFDDLVSKAKFLLENENFKKMQSSCVNESKKYSKATMKENIFERYLIL